MDSIVRNQATMAQIRCLEDAELNPLTKKAWPKSHNTILQSRRKLPVYGGFGEILDAYHKGQAFVLLSETGSGKSTQVPQMLLYDEGRLHPTAPASRNPTGQTCFQGDGSCLGRGGWLSDWWR